MSEAKKQPEPSAKVEPWMEEAAEQIREHLRDIRGEATSDCIAEIIAACAHAPAAPTAINVREAAQRITKLANMGIERNLFIREETVCKILAECAAPPSAEVAALVEALEKIAKLDYARAASNCAAYHAVNIARAALEPFRK